MPAKEKTTEHTERVDGERIPRCHPGQTVDKPVYEQSDSKGNKFEIFCKNGSYVGFFTPVGGKPVCVGKCKYRLGHNDVYKKLLSTFKVSWRLDPDSLVIYEVDTLIAQEIQIINWKNIEPVGPPPTTGTKPYGAMGDGEDVLWVFDAATGNITSQKTKHTGHWVLDPNGDLTKPGDWTWVVSEQKPDGAPTIKPAPAGPDELGMMVPGSPRFSRITAAGEYADATVAPFTILIDEEPHTLAVVRPPGSERFHVERIEAMVGEPFRLDLKLPNKEERLLRFALLEGPSGMRIDRLTGSIRWTPKADQVGVHPVAIVHRYYGLTPHVDEFDLPVKRSKRRERKRRPVRSTR